MPAQHRLRLYESTEGPALHQAVEGSHDRPICLLQCRPLDLTPQDAELMSQQQKKAKSIEVADTSQGAASET